MTPWWPVHSRAMRSASSFASLPVQVKKTRLRGAEKSAKSRSA